MFNKKTPQKTTKTINYSLNENGTSVCENKLLQAVHMFCLSNCVFPGNQIDQNNVTKKWREDFVNPSSFICFILCDPFLLLYDLFCAMCSNISG